MKINNSQDGIELEWFSKGWDSAVRAYEIDKSAYKRHQSAFLNREIFYDWRFIYFLLVGGFCSWFYVWKYLSMNKQTQEALKMAIEALEMHVPHYIKDRGCEAINACKEALNQPAQEVSEQVPCEQPVAWLAIRDGEVINAYPYKPNDDDGYWKAKGFTYIPLYTHPAPQPAQEPFAIGNELTKEAIARIPTHPEYGIEWLNPIPPRGTLLYTHPHQWQGLTDDEILKASSYIDMLGDIDDDDVIKFARAVEAKHGIVTEPERFGDDWLKSIDSVEEPQEYEW